MGMAIIKTKRVLEREIHIMIIRVKCYIVILVDAN